MLCWTQAPSEKCWRETKFSYSDEIFHHQKIKFFATKTFVAKGVSENTISDDNYFVVEYNI